MKELFGCPSGTNSRKAAKKRIKRGAPTSADALNSLCANPKITSGTNCLSNIYVFRGGKYWHFNGQSKPGKPFGELTLGGHPAKQKWPKMRLPAGMACDEFGWFNVYSNRWSRWPTDNQSDDKKAVKPSEPTVLEQPILDEEPEDELEECKDGVTETSSISKSSHSKTWFITEDQKPTKITGSEGVLSASRTTPKPTESESTETETQTPTDSSQETAEPTVSEASELPVSQTPEPSVSETSESLESETSPMVVSESSEPQTETSESIIADMTEPLVSETTEPTVSETSEPSVSETSEPTVSEASEPSADATSESPNTESEPLSQSESPTEEPVATTTPSYGNGTSPVRFGLDGELGDDLANKPNGNGGDGGGMYCVATTFTKVRGGLVCKYTLKNKILKIKEKCRPVDEEWHRFPPNLVAIIITEDKNWYFFNNKGKYCKRADKVYDEVSADHCL